MMVIIHAAYCVGSSQAKRDALQVGFVGQGGLQVLYRAAGLSGRWTDDAAAYRTASVRHQLESYVSELPGLGSESAWFGFGVWMTNGACHWLPRNAITPKLCSLLALGSPVFIGAHRERESNASLDRQFSIYWCPERERESKASSNRPFRWSS
jgi:hypothetical protein